ncbi:heme O synthase-like polyprenyltransferase [Croceifilum oryzae]|uniref:Heme O synthase-like polyprenyltransferase n=1 Tax=Croceifilum oryzae TaxID=1553429 RepID=A0AAJ1THW0_9BACL|nr:heme O synthase-like polyprenyltransferase [Croceifilum oryzae]
MYPSWSELSRFVPVFFLWSAIMSALFVELAVDKNFLNLYMILKGIWIIVFGLWNIKLLRKYRNDRKYVRNVYVISIVSICFYTIFVSYKTSFSFPSIIPYLFPFVIALLFVVPAELFKHIDKYKKQN